MIDILRYIRKNSGKSSEGPRRQGLTMIAVLGEEGDREVVATFCRHYHWEVLFLKTCQEALSLVDDLKPQIILMDRDAAGADWRAEMSSLASASSGACIMLVSRVVDDQLWNEVVLNGGYEVLPKPIQREEVSRAVRLAWSYWSSAANSWAIAKK